MDLPLRKAWPPLGIQRSATVPVVAGSDGTTVSTLTLPPCAACGTAHKDIVRRLTDLGRGDRTDRGAQGRTADDFLYVMLCVDGAACARRYRAGRTPVQYTQHLRQEAGMA